MSKQEYHCEYCFCPKDVWKPMGTYESDRCCEFYDDVQNLAQVLEDDNGIVDFYDLVRACEPLRAEYTDIQDLRFAVKEIFDTFGEVGCYKTNIILNLTGDKSICFTPSELTVREFKNLGIKDIKRCHICGSLEADRYRIDGVVASEKSGIDFTLPLCENCKGTIENSDFDSVSDLDMLKRLAALVDFRLRLNNDLLESVRGREIELTAEKKKR